MQTPKEEAIRVQTLKLLPVNHPLVRRRISRHSKRMEKISRKKPYRTRKFVSPTSAAIQQKIRDIHPMHMPAYA